MKRVLLMIASLAAIFGIWAKSAEVARWHPVAV
jgi:hypothetical protein